MAALLGDSWTQAVVVTEEVALMPLTNEESTDLIVKFGNAVAVTEKEAYKRCAEVCRKRAKKHEDSSARMSERMLWDARDRYESLAGEAEACAEAIEAVINKAEAETLRRIVKAIE